MKKNLLLYILMIAYITANAQVKKWETIFDPGAEYDYYTKLATPPASWKALGFVKTTDWKSGRGPIGFGPIMSRCNNCLTAPKTTTIYSRTNFTIKDTSHIEALSLFIDYMDGFVAYINGVEVARGNMGKAGEPTTAYQTADSPHFLDYYSKEVYSGYLLKKEILKNVLVNGNNVLAVEVHDDVATATEVLFYTILNVGLNTNVSEYDTCYTMYPLPNDNDSSKLPIVKLNFSSPMVPDEGRITVDMKIVDNGDINHFSDSVYAYSGKVTIERRGSASQGFPKRSYGFTTIDESGNDTSVSLLGLPREKDWILKGEMEDRTMLRDVLTYELAREMGHYAPRSRFCELYINGTHMGLFAIMEKIKRDTFRVDIAKLKETDNSGLDVTGGYLLKIDKTTGGSKGGFSSSYKAPLQSLKPYFQYEYPKGDKITESQKTYIQEFMSSFENVLRSENYKDKTEGYRKYISVKSFIDYMISQELARNVDGYRISTFLYKEKDKSYKNGKLHMGPVWDFNLAYGYSGDLCRSSWSDEGWGYDYNKDCPGDNFYIPFWWDRLLQDPDFRTEYKARWDELRSGPLHLDLINAAIDSLVQNNIDGIAKNNFIWTDVFKTSLWPNNPIADDYAGEISYLKNFISDRIIWLDSHIPEVCEEVIYTSAPSISLKVGQVKAYPMPFDEEVKISYYSEGGNAARLRIYNTAGQQIYIADDVTAAGQNAFVWNGVSNTGNKLKSGVYMYTLELDNNIVVKSKLLKK